MRNCVKVKMSAPAKMRASVIRQQKIQGGHKFFTTCLKSENHVVERLKQWA